MILALAVALLCQESDPQTFRASADRLTERVQWIATTIRDLGEKRRVHPEALSEVEAYLKTVNRGGTDLQAKARQIEDLKRQFDAKQKEYDQLEQALLADRKVYDQQLQQFNAARNDLNSRWDKYKKERDELEARRNGLTNDQIEEFNRNVDRLNAVRSNLSAEDSRVESVDRPALNAAWERLERKNTEFRALGDVYFDLDSEYRKEVRGFRSAIRSMEGPAEALYSLLQEATGKRAASLVYRIFERRSEAEAISLAAAFGSGADLPDGPFAQALIIRSAQDRAATRDYIVERLRLGELIESLRGLAAVESDKSVSADRSFDPPSPTGLASKPCALVKGATWTMKLPDGTRLAPLPPPALR